MVYTSWQKSLCIFALSVLTLRLIRRYFFDVYSNLYQHQIKVHYIAVPPAAVAER